MATAPCDDLPDPPGESAHDEASELAAAFITHAVAVWALELAWDKANVE